MAVTSADGFIAMLDERNVKLKVAALNKLDHVVNHCWFEIADVIGKIESLYEDEGFPERKLAALVASKVYFHLGSYEDALILALGAQDLFNINSSDLYVETIISKGIDHYSKLRTQNADIKDEKDKKPIDPRLEAIVNKMFERAINHKQYREAIGLAFESRRLDMLERAINDSDDPSRYLSYAVKSTIAWIQNRQYRNEILSRLIKLYSSLRNPDYINMSQCLIFLEDPQSIAEILEKLISDTEENTLMAYQIAFDSYESATQQFIGRVLQSLRQHSKLPMPDSAASSAAITDHSVSVVADTGDSMDVDDSVSLTEEKVLKHTVQMRTQNLIRILSGDETISMHLQFLIKNNKTDMLILKTVKETVRNSVAHTATVIANAFMHAGTTCDDFLRDNLEWVSRATNWSKFSAVGSLGIIHKGHENDAMRVLETYLPKDAANAGSAGYMEGGGLYALGLIHANHGNSAVIEYLKKQLNAATAEAVRHGACMGLGLAAMGTQRKDVCDLLRQNLHLEDAVTGEAAGLSIGLVMLGSMPADIISDMLSYAAETKHEKILRGVSVGLACMMYGRMEDADALVESLSRDKDPLLRRSGVYTLALAYCGTGNTEAVRRLLHVAVSDVNDDVRRAAVTCLGFLLFRKPEECPPMVALLAESFNPNVRYGAALALGIACAGTGSKEAISLIEPMLNDQVSYVRQGAMIASALIMIQQNEVTCPKVKDFRATLTKSISDKHEEVMARFGAIVAQGILDAGGRNVTISMQSRNGHTDLSSVIGMLVFLQHWYWFPLSHFLSLCFQPTCLIALTSDLKMPVMEFKSNARPSFFAYPPPTEEKKEKQAEKVETAILSITNKAKKKHEKMKQAHESDKMEIDQPAKKDEKKDEAKEKKDEDSSVSVGVDKDKKETKPAEIEPNFQMLKNPARVMKQQLRAMSLPDDCRFAPMKNIQIGGIIMVRDKRSDQPTEYVQLEKTGGARSEEESEPEPPQPFEFREDSSIILAPAQ